MESVAGGRATDDVKCEQMTNMLRNLLDFQRKLHVSEWEPSEAYSKYMVQAPMGLNAHVLPKANMTIAEA